MAVAVAAVAGSVEFHPVVVVPGQQLLAVLAVHHMGNNIPVACNTLPKQQSNLVDWWLSVQAHWQQVFVQLLQQLPQPAAGTTADNMLPKLPNSLAVQSDQLGLWVGQAAVGQVVEPVVAVALVDQTVVGMDAVVAVVDDQTVAADQTAFVDPAVVVDQKGAAMVDSDSDSSFLHHHHLAGSSFGHLGCLQIHLLYYHH